MSHNLKTRVAALFMGAAALMSIVGCDLGNATPTAIPTNTALQEASTPTTAPTIAEATPTAGATDTPVSSLATPTEASAQASPTEQSQGGVTPSDKPPLSFAAYNLQPTSVNPSLQAYKVQPGLANVTNAGDFALSQSSKSLIEQYAFAAQFPQGNQYKQFYQLYEDGRYGEKPVFVSTDSVLHVYHLIFDKLLRDTETTYLINDLKELTSAMLKASQAQYEDLKGTSGENAAKRNVAYYAVTAKLLNLPVEVPSYVQAVVNQELNLIQQHAGPSTSAVMAIGNSTPYIEEYGQYKPRGHYTRSEALKQYFMAMMYYGRMTFRLKVDEETRSALLMTQALQSTKTESGKSASDVWASIYDPTSFFVGGSDDLSYRDYGPVMQQALGPNPTAKDVTDDAKLAKFKELSKSLAGPRINSMWVWIWEDKEDATKGFRMMGQRFTLDEYVFGQLIWRNVGDDNNQRWLPKALDISAAFGSQEAYDILDQMGETKYPKYASQMDKVRGEIKNLATSEWTQNLYWSWLYTFHPLLAPKAQDSGYPSFMTNAAWTRKDLNTVNGSWTELKHDTILYAKQVMAEMGGGPPTIVKGYVEPEPEFYARVAALINMTREGLVARGLLEKPKDQYAQGDYNTLSSLETMALDLKAISEKELQGQALTDEQYSLIMYYGGRLESFTAAASDPAEPGAQGRTDLNDQDAAVIADVATGKDAQDALEEGTGRIMEIYVVVPIEGKLVLTRGGIYSQYEFVQPTSDRLTDEQWRQRLDNGQVPPLGDWKTFIAK